MIVNLLRGDAVSDFGGTIIGAVISALTALVVVRLQQRGGLDYFDIMGVKYLKRRLKGESDHIPYERLGRHATDIGCNAEEGEDRQLVFLAGWEPDTNPKGDAGEAKWSRKRWWRRMRG
jgi:hypothetical protein